MKSERKSVIPISLGNKIIGPGYPVLIIAEAGVNHFGQLERAFRLVDMAADAGADVLKIQVYNTDRMISGDSPDWKARMKSKELTQGQVQEVAEYCRQKGLLFLASAHDSGSLEFLLTLDVPAIKIGSGELGNSFYLEQAADTGLPVILSTGMHSLEDVGEAVSIFSKRGNKDLILMHCISLYPAEPEEVNLKALDTLQKTFNHPVGYSDHTRGYDIVLAAVARGAMVIEKHIALEKEFPGTWDPLVSCTEDNLGEMISSIRRIETALGTGEKKPAPRELESLQWATKSIVAKADIPRGTVITRELIDFKRPGTGIRPNRINELLNRKSKIDIKKDTIIMSSWVE
ncbi:MAG: N-acetylneuraminate synthase family protein [Deltaproteobacteria bacterium]|nr:N-acetylneuraminate synthase family protein [Deltaproteobacteria bacterium]